MSDLIAQHGLEILFGTTALITSIIAIYYARATLYYRRDRTLNDKDRSVQVFLSREAMIGTLLDMYSRAESGDMIWAQTIGMRNYPGDVRDRLLGAASRGASFRLILNRNAPTLSEFRTLFEPVRSAQIVEGGDNSLRIQGLSNKEVVIAFPTLTTYTAVRITDPAFVSTMRHWFDERFDAIAARSESPTR